MNCANTHWDCEHKQELLSDIAGNDHKVEGEDIFDLNTGFCHPDDMTGLVALGIRFGDLEEAWAQNDV